MEPELFDTYLAIDPSLWWDSERLVDSAVTLLGGRVEIEKRLYLAASSQAGIVEPTARLARLLSEGAPEIELVHSEFPGETHLTIYHPAALLGFRSVLGPVDPD
jgi:predicted alpha/beta superfamily hydrolase